MKTFSATMILCPEYFCCLWFGCALILDMILSVLTSGFPLAEHRLPDDGQGEEQNTENPHTTHKHGIHIEI